MEPASLSQSTRLRRGFASMPLAPLVSAGFALACGLALRVWMLLRFFEVSGDSQLYGAMAKNLVLHGRYAVDSNGVLHETLIRLPGYPLFLTACFRLFGVENYFAPTCIQVGLDLAACVFAALLVWRITGRMAAAQGALWLACLCPFTAIFCAFPLTETPTVFCIALALWAIARFQDHPDWTSALAFTFATAWAALLRPDGALVGVAFVPALLLVTGGGNADGDRRGIVRKLLICLLLALAPFAAWTWRNWRTFHVFQPLAPRYATDPGEPTWPGFQRWMKTWCLDFVSTYQVYWNMPGAPLDVNQLPARAFDSPAQRAETAGLFAEYEENGEELSPSIDAGFAELARQRIAERPLRYYVWLPLGRVADMLFRPRIENLPIDLDWWVYSHHWAETRFSWFYAGLNAAYFLLGGIGLCLRPRLWRWMLVYFVLRCALLATIEAPEARYTIEFFPLIFPLAGVAVARMKRAGSRGGRTGGAEAGPSLLHPSDKDPSPGPVRSG